MVNGVDTDGETLSTADFDEPDGSATYDGMDYVDGAKDSPALAFQVPGSKFYQLVHGYQLVLDPGQTVANASHVGVAVKTPHMENPKVLDRKRIRSYDELSWSNQKNSDQNEFTELDLSNVPEKTVEVEEHAWIVLTYDNADATNNAFNPANVDLELEVEEGRMSDLEAAQQ